MKHAAFKTLCVIQALRLMLRVWRLHKRTGIPYLPLLEAHLQVMQQTTVEILVAQHFEEQQRIAAETAWKN